MIGFAYRCVWPTVTSREAVADFRSLRRFALRRFPSQLALLSAYDLPGTDRGRERQKETVGEEEALEQTESSSAIVARVAPPLAALAPFARRPLAQPREHPAVFVLPPRERRERVGVVLQIRVERCGRRRRRIVGGRSD